MITAYLDKNVLSHVLTVQRTGVDTNRVSLADVRKLQSAVARVRVRNLMSVVQIQEAAYALNARSEQVAKEELKLIRELLFQEEVIKFPNDLLFEDILNYANDKGQTYPLMPNSIDLDGLFCFEGDIEERRRDLADATKQAFEMSKRMTDANSNDREIILSEFGGAQPKFGEFYTARITRRLKELVQSAEKHGRHEGLLSACERPMAVTNHSGTLPIFSRKKKGMR